MNNNNKDYEEKLKYFDEKIISEHLDNIEFFFNKATQELLFCDVIMFFRKLIIVLIDFFSSEMIDEKQQHLFLRTLFKEISAYEYGKVDK